MIETRIAAALLAAFGAAAASAADEYRRFTPDEPALDWRAANEAVRSAGGHAGMQGGHARPAPAAKDERAPAAKPAAPAAGSAPPAKPADRHEGHAGHGAKP